MAPFLQQPQAERRQISILPGESVTFRLLRDRPGHRVYRVWAGQSRFILKVFRGGAPAGEIKVYTLLQALAVPTLPVHMRGDKFLLIEDLADSPTWRLANEEDLGRAEVGRALADWYRQLHAAGRGMPSHANGAQDDLHCWIDALDADALSLAGERLGLAEAPAWQDALSQLDGLKDRYRAFPQTFNYSDFAAENLAITREGIAPVQAIVFDYDCFSTGAVYSDYRNVITALHGAGREAFQQTYGPVDPEEKRVDDILSLLEGVLVASQREHLPGWARPVIAAFLT